MRRQIARPRPKPDAARGRRRGRARTAGRSARAAPPARPARGPRRRISGARRDVDLDRLAGRRMIDRVAQQVVEHDVERLDVDLVRHRRALAQHERDPALARDRLEALDRPRPRAGAGPCARGAGRRRPARDSTSSLSTSAFIRRTSASVSSATCSQWPASRGLRRATSRFVEITVSGVRSSCDASAANWRWAATPRSMRVSDAVERDRTAGRARRPSADRQALVEVLAGHLRRRLRSPCRGARSCRA